MLPFYYHSQTQVALLGKKTNKKKQKNMALENIVCRDSGQPQVIDLLT